MATAEAISSAAACLREASTSVFDRNDSGVGGSGGAGALNLGALDDVCQLAGSLPAAAASGMLDSTGSGTLHDAVKDLIAAVAAVATDAATALLEPPGGGGGGGGWCGGPGAGGGARSGGFGTGDGDDLFDDDLDMPGTGGGGGMGPMGGFGGRGTQAPPQMTQGMPGMTQYMGAMTQRGGGGCCFPPRFDPRNGSRVGAGLGGVGGGRRPRARLRGSHANDAAVASEMTARAAITATCARTHSAAAAATRYSRNHGTGRTRRRRR